MLSLQTKSILEKQINLTCDYFLRQHFFFEIVRNIWSRQNALKRGWLVIYNPPSKTQSANLILGNRTYQREDVVISSHTWHSITVTFPCPINHTCAETSISYKSIFLFLLVPRTWFMCWNVFRVFLAQSSFFLLFISLQSLSFTNL